jgi:predicted dehydrogenase
MRSAILVGIGKMGSVWADKIMECEGIRLESIVDTDKSKRELVHNIGLEWCNGISDIPEDKKFDIWFVTTPVENHFEYMKKAIESGARTIFVEKPSTSTPQDSKYILNRARENNVRVAVDYIERKNPVTSRILSDIKDKNFKPSELVHWRGKTSDSVVPFMRDDFCHDISEIELLLSETGGDFSNLGTLEVNNLRTWVESERDVNAYFDVGATMIIDSVAENPR